ncbi:MAG TPA: GAF domain-containing protein, partial [Thiotrichaceae bacterium]|nr:GAF domain-containing protein [Thiotrichaceae bacterium]
TEFEESERLVKVVLCQAKTVLDQVKVYEIQMQAYTAQNQLLKVVETMRAVVKLLGVEFPEQPNDSDIEQALEETLSLLGDKPIEDLIELPEMTDPEKLAVMRILSGALITVGITVPELAALITFKLVNLSIKHGNAPASAYGYATCGFMFCGIVGDIETGFKFGELALSVLERFNALELKAKVFEVINLAVRPWKEPLKNTLKAFLEAYKSALETGDLEYAANSAFDYLFYAYFTGKELTVLSKETVTYTEAIRQLKQEAYYTYFDLIRQVVLNLTLSDNGDNPGELIGEACNEITMLPHLKQANDQLGIFFLYMYKLVLYYLFHDYSGALEKAAEKVEPDVLENQVAGTFFKPIFYFYESLARLAVFPYAPEAEQKAILDKVTTYQKQMQHWAQHAPMNFQHKYDLVEAEKARVLGPNWEAAELYEQAIIGARHHGYIQEEALAYELAAKFYLERGLEKIAQTYIKEAHYAYQKWGAVAKVKHLEALYPQWRIKTAAATGINYTRMTMTSTIKSRASTATLSSLTTLASESPLDLSTVMKASQAISSEIMLQTLIKTFMQIVIENVGAEQGCLILKSGESGGLFIEAYATLEEVTVLDSILIESLESCQGQTVCLSQAIVTYTARTQMPQVLNDASREGLFTNDPYIVQKRPLSVLCFPMMYKNQLMGLFYLENNQTTGAFTAERLAVLTMLSTQIAISLENAQYANHLEEKVKQRTAQLAEANEEITALNEMLKEDNLRMGAELDVAKQLQQMVLPAQSELTQIAGLDIAGFMEPADEVGGDYYDVLVHEGRVKIGIGDVTGHGLESGVLMLMVQTAVRTLLDSGLSDATQFLNTLNHTICHNTRRMKTDKNLTLSLLDYQAIPPGPPSLQQGEEIARHPFLQKGGGGGIIKVTGQHEEVLVFRAGGCVERI